jgi:hypothetical protein
MFLEAIGFLSGSLNLRIGMMTKYSEINALSDGSLRGIPKSQLLFWPCLYLQICSKIVKKFFSILDLHRWSSTEFER